MKRRVTLTMLKTPVRSRGLRTGCAVWWEVDAGEVAVHPTRVMAPSSHSATG